MVSVIVSPYVDATLIWCRYVSSKDSHEPLAAPVQSFGASQRLLALLRGAWGLLRRPWANMLGLFCDPGDSCSTPGWPAERAPHRPHAGSLEPPQQNVRIPQKPLGAQQGLLAILQQTWGFSVDPGGSSAPRPLKVPQRWTLSKAAGGRISGHPNIPWWLLNGTWALLWPLGLP